ncbi:GNAT family N-acetyltransferase [Balneola sp. MJW-20]|uniref:GNAT family N-acetyltransferase n=1 Tax=Gracilimonas aurantiaca TaxID=3234185 RepID=UPI003467EA83
MEIRKAVPKDLKQVRALNKQAVPNVNDIGNKELKYFLDTASLFLVAESDDEILGFMILLAPGLDYESLNYRFFAGNYTDFLYVDRIVVKPSEQRNGIGKALYNEIIHLNPGKKITCEVNVVPYNAASLAFHKAMGFKEIAQQVTENGKKKVSLQIRN